MKPVRRNKNPSLRLVVDCVSLSIATIDLAIDMAVSVKTPLQVVLRTFAVTGKTLKDT